jgi:hypothetical protein
MSPDLLAAALLLALFACAAALGSAFTWWTLKSADVGRRLARFARRLLRRALLVAALVAIAYVAL